MSIKSVQANRRLSYHGAVLISGTLALALSACTTANGPIPKRETPTISQVTLNSPIIVGPDSVRAYFKKGGSNGEHTSCYFEVNTLRGPNAPEVIIGPGTFHVTRVRRMSDPVGGGTRYLSFAFSEDGPSDIEMTTTWYTSDDRGTDVRAIRCRETFYQFELAHYSDLNDLAAAAGPALSW